MRKPELESQLINWQKSHDNSRLKNWIEREERAKTTRCDPELRRELFGWAYVNGEYLLFEICLEKISAESKKGWIELCRSEHYRYDLQEAKHKRTYAFTQLLIAENMPFSELEIQLINESTDVDGNTLLHYMALQEEVDTIFWQHFLVYKINVFVHNSQGMTPLDCAIHVKNYSVVKFLLLSSQYKSDYQTLPESASEDYLYPLQLLDHTKMITMPALSTGASSKKDTLPDFLDTDKSHAFSKAVSEFKACKDFDVNKPFEKLVSLSDHALDQPADTLTDPAATTLTFHSIPKVEAIKLLTEKYKEQQKRDDKKFAPDLLHNRTHVLGLLNLFSTKLGIKNLTAFSGCQYLIDKKVADLRKSATTPDVTNHIAYDILATFGLSKQFGDTFATGRVSKIQKAFIETINASPEPSSLTKQLDQVYAVAAQLPDPYQLHFKHLVSIMAKCYQCYQCYTRPKESLEQLSTEVADIIHVVDIYLKEGFSLQLPELTNLHQDTVLLSRLINDFKNPAMLSSKSIPSIYYITDKAEQHKPLSYYCIYDAAANTLKSIHYTNYCGETTSCHDTSLDIYFGSQTSQLDLKRAIYDWHKEHRTYETILFKLAILDKLLTFLNDSHPDPAINNYLKKTTLLIKFIKTTTQYYQQGEVNTVDMRLLITELYNNIFEHIASSDGSAANLFQFYSKVQPYFQQAFCQLKDGRSPNAALHEIVATSWKLLQADPIVLDKKMVDDLISQYFVLPDCLLSDQIPLRSLLLVLHEIAIAQQQLATATKFKHLLMLHQFLGSLDHEKGLISLVTLDKLLKIFAQIAQEHDAKTTYAVLISLSNVLTQVNEDDIHDSLGLLQAFIAALSKTLTQLEVNQDIKLSLALFQILLSTKRLADAKKLALFEGLKKMTRILFGHIEPIYPVLHEHAVRQKVEASLDVMQATQHYQPGLDSTHSKSLTHSMVALSRLLDSKALGYTLAMPIILYDCYSDLTALDQDKRTNIVLIQHLIHTMKRAMQLDTENTIIVESCVWLTTLLTGITAILQLQADHERDIVSYINALAQVIDTAKTELQALGDKYSTLVSTLSVAEKALIAVSVTKKAIKTLSQCSKLVTSIKTAQLALSVTSEDSENKALLQKGIEILFASDDEAPLKQLAQQILGNEQLLGLIKDNVKSVAGSFVTVSANAAFALTPLGAATLLVTASTAIATYLIRGDIKKLQATVERQADRLAEGQEYILAGINAINDNLLIVHTDLKRDLFVVSTQVASVHRAMVDRYIDLKQSMTDAFLRVDNRFNRIEQQLYNLQAGQQHIVRLLNLGFASIELSIQDLSYQIWLQHYVAAANEVITTCREVTLFTLTTDITTEGTLNQAMLYLRNLLKYFVSPTEISAIGYSILSGTTLSESVIEKLITDRSTQIYFLTGLVNTLATKHKLLEQSKTVLMNSFIWLRLSLSVIQLLEAMGKKISSQLKHEEAGYTLIELILHNGINLLEFSQQLAEPASLRKLFDQHEVYLASEAAKESGSVNTELQFLAVYAGIRLNPTKSEVVQRAWNQPIDEPATDEQLLAKGLRKIFVDSFYQLAKDSSFYFVSYQQVFIKYIMMQLLIAVKHSMGDATYHQLTERILTTGKATHIKCIDDTFKTQLEVAALYPINFFAPGIKGATVDADTTDAPTSVPMLSAS